ncbi:ammonium transporter [Eupransor demetentiae]|uniref:Ammonium transporter n=1 Tax=Eupransor demetentiae TaxID=3109584 RepID=A0ABM9N5L1_9LACO|nr:Ammonia channel protein AmtB (AmtB) [Lactobacillaceae bacterium LMG 33000]
MDSGSIAFVLISALLVWIMTPGLGLFYAGLGRQENRQHTIIVSLLLVGVTAVVWVLIGYSLAFGGVGKYLALNNLSFDRSTRGLKIPDGLFALFQGMFPIITVAIITGSIIGRMRIKAMLVFLSLWIIVVYSPLAHMVWDNGFLAKLGAIDFAGGTVVHISSGLTGLILALILGKRNPGEEGKIDSRYVLLGGIFLWLGWFGFNAGSALAANGQAILAFANTWAASAIALLTYAAVAYQRQGKLSIADLMTGALTGLVVITPAAGFVQIWAALLMGAIVGPVGYWSITALKAFFGYDDTLDAFGIHGIGGILGALLTGVFADPKLAGSAGLISGHWDLLAKQALAVLVTVVLVTVGSIILAGLTRIIIGPLRVDARNELRGFDFRLHILIEE